MEDFFQLMLSRPQFLDDRRGFPHKLEENYSSAVSTAAERGRGMEFRDQKNKTTQNLQVIMKGMYDSGSTGDCQREWKA